MIDTENGNATGLGYSPVKQRGWGMDCLRITAGRGPRAIARRLVRRFFVERRGAVAIEFAVLAFPFLLLLFAILESCIAYAAQELMSNAVDDLVRQLLTGQLRAGGVNEETARDFLCQRMELLFPAGCRQEIRIDLRSFGTFEQAAMVFDGTLPPATFVFDPGGPQEKNVIRVFYQWPVITNILHGNLADDRGEMLLYATRTWQNEPFGGTNPPPAGS